MSKLHCNNKCEARLLQVICNLQYVMPSLLIEGILFVQKYIFWLLQISKLMSKKKKLCFMYSSLPSLRCSLGLVYESSLFTVQFNRWSRNFSNDIIGKIYCNCVSWPIQIKVCAYYNIFVCSSINLLSNRKEKIIMYIKVCQII